MKMEQRPDLETRPAVMLEIRALGTFLATVISIEAGEIFIGALSAWWGFIAALRFVAYVHTLESAEAYRIVARSSIVLILILCWWGSVVATIYGIRRKHITVRCNAMLVAALTWGAMAGLVVIAAIMRGINTWSGPAVIFAITAAWTYWRLRTKRAALRVLPSDRLKDYELE